MTSTRYRARLTDSDRLSLAARFEAYLAGRHAGDPVPRSDREAAERIGWQAAAPARKGGQAALVLPRWRACLAGFGAAGEQLAVGAGVRRGRGAGGELPGVGPARGRVGALAAQDA